MKNLLIRAFGLLSIALAGVSCDEDPVAPSLSASPTTLSFAAGEVASQTIVVATTATDWTFDTDATWIKLEKKESSLIVSVEPFTGTEPREKTISIMTANSGPGPQATPAIVTVTQQPLPPKNTLSISPTSLTFAAGEDDPKSVTVTSDAEYCEARLLEDTWFDAVWSSDGSRLIVSVNGLNFGSAIRRGDITFTAGTADPVILSVSQAPTPVNLSLSSSSLEFGASETGSKTVNVTTNSPDGWSASESISWLMTSKSGSTLTVDVTSANTSADPRSGVITISSGGQTRDLTVTQAGAALVFGDIKYGTYSASGTPRFLDTPGPKTWTGTIRPNTSGQYYELTNFGGISDITVRLKFKQGKIYIDGAYLVADNSNFNGYLRACYDDDTSWNVLNATYDHPVDYDMATRTLSFNGYISAVNPSYRAIVGVVAEHKTEHRLGAFTDFYADLKIKLTFSSTRAGVDESVSQPAKGLEVLKPAAGKTLRYAQ
jgi:hypothetical protein